MGVSSKCLKVSKSLQMSLKRCRVPTLFELAEEMQDFERSFARKFCKTYANGEDVKNLLYAGGEYYNQVFKYSEDVNSITEATQVEMGKALEMLRNELGKESSQNFPQLD